MRRIIAIASQLVAHLDLMDNYGALFWGDKRTLAILLADTYIEVSSPSPNSSTMTAPQLHLPAERLSLELSLLQPNWLSAMVSHRLMTG